MKQETISKFTNGRKETEDQDENETKFQSERHWYQHPLTGGFSHLYSTSVSLCVLEATAKLITPWQNTPDTMHTVEVQVSKNNNYINI